MSEDGVGPREAIRLLVVDAHEGVGSMLAPALASEFALSPEVVEVRCGRMAIDLLRNSTFDVIAAELESLADLAAQAEERIERLARAGREALIVVLAKDCSISFALGAMRAGAHDCASHDLPGAEIVARIGALAHRHGKARYLARSRRPAEFDRAALPASEPGIPNMHDLVLPMWRQEQKIIETAIQRFAGNIAMAAAALELSPSTIYRKRQAWAELAQRRADLARVSAR